MGSKPDFETELALGGVVVGVDEVGRGPLCGPVTAAAVVLDPGSIPDGLNDSKKVPLARRLALFEILHQVANVSIGWASVAEIDTMNIRAASLLAMRRAVEGLPQMPGHALIDGTAVPDGLPCPATALIKGDARSLSIAAASIVAKVARDRVMVALAQQHPGYGWERNMGYPTAEHLGALRRLGVTPVHRRSFRPVHNILYQEKS
ncbi:MULTISPECIES: ribonuclease HII [Paracoccaceae]|jgi:ribonuclease HII|uniref:ribonuclease HII n=1 Tax=Rhodobacterales TaxID=204455 RepID=UPI001B08DE79|nr:ribonuclease HII [Boseongicola sp. H5]MBO6603731.1 ribonuclease HII [Roseicyclus sp.]MBO6623388.1 ribonuclease HII [Roseicyclus sp.]MBO6920724.1 ribonuclease HII [Roseicyclus sp.]